jgi:hypothetical protein
VVHYATIFIVEVNAFLAWFGKVCKVCIPPSKSILVGCENAAASYTGMCPRWTAPPGTHGKKCI